MIVCRLVLFSDKCILLRDAETKFHFIDRLGLGFCWDYNEGIRCSKALQSIVQDVTLLLGIHAPY